MSQSHLKMRPIAQRLIALETVVGESSEPQTQAPMAFRVCEKLSRPLVGLTGVGGFRSLLSRALALASAEADWLRGMRVDADGSLEFPAEMAQLERKEVAEGEIALTTQLLELLVTFIGEPLTLSLVRHVWSTAPIDAGVST
jgi:hypothetical protein